ncbi:MAG: hypothetical protein ABR521_12305 [Gaiellaceae bacterium]
MKRLALLLACAGTAHALAGAASAATVFGVTENAGKYSTDGGAAFFDRLRDVGMTVNAVTVLWDPDHPQRIAERDLLDRMVATASARGVRVVFTVYATRPTALTAAPAAPAQFAGFLRLLARTYPYVREFAVHNEPNYGVFWRPQFGADGSPAAGAAYAALLARSYDALKAVDPHIAVLGFGLAPRGNDNPAVSAASTSPVRFIRDAGAAYRRSGRSRPIMDAFAYHPYPASSLNTPATKQGWPQAGVADLGRIKQAVWDAFHDTAQPTFETGLPLKITEVGWQAEIPAAALAAYRGEENVRTIDDATHGRIYAQLVRELACDPAVTEVLFFHLIDERELSGFQSGLVRADGSERPAYAAVKRAIAETRGRCGGTPVAWRHSETVQGGSVAFGEAGFSAAAEEGATWTAAIVSVEGPPSGAERAALADALERGRQPRGTRLLRAGALEPHAPAALSRTASPLPPGRYVQALLLRAATAPERSTFFLSEVFEVGEEPPATAPAPAEPATGPVSPAATASQPAGPAPVAPASPPTPAAVPAAPAPPADVPALVAPAERPPPAVRQVPAVRREPPAPTLAFSVAPVRRPRAAVTVLPSEASFVRGDSPRARNGARRPAGVSRPVPAPRARPRAVPVTRSGPDSPLPGPAIGLLLLAALCSAGVAVRLLR